jgi:hypothetical protein
MEDTAVDQGVEGEVEEVGIVQFVPTEDLRGFEPWLDELGV